jgi:hypothetical protein
MPVKYRKAVQNQDTGAMRVALHAGSPPRGGGDKRNVSIQTLEFLLDPRLTVYAVGTLEIEAAEDGAGKRLNVQASAAQWPGTTSWYMGTQHGSLSVSSDVNVVPDRLGARMAVFRGKLPVVLVTASKQVEWDIVNGAVADHKPHRVGDWTLTVSESRTLPRMGPGGSGPAQPDREFLLKVERMSDKAPPFPKRKESIVHFVGSTGYPSGGVKEPAAKDPLVQEWPVQLVTNRMQNPATKMIVDVPVEVKAVVLPFEFKDVVLSGSAVGEDGNVAMGGGGGDGVAVPVADAPALDKVVTLAPFTLKTKGKSPQEAYAMLGEAAGVKFVTERDWRVGGNAPNVWQMPRQPIDVDLERVNFWAAAMGLGERAAVVPTGDNYSLSVEPISPNYRRPVQVQDTGAMRVALHAGPALRTAADDIAPVWTLEFLMDPRLAVCAVGALDIQAADDAGKKLEVKSSTAKWPGDTRPYLGVNHGILAITNEVRIFTQGTSAATAVIRGNLPVVVATASKRVEWDMVNGAVTDHAPHRVGDWTITALESHVMRSGARSGPEQPDREFMLKVERMSDKAPPFPACKDAIVHFEGSAGAPVGGVTTAGVPTAGVKEPTGNDPLVQEWPVRLVTVGLRHPATKMIVDVPVEVKEVVLPFEFKDMALKSGLHGGVGVGTWETTAQFKDIEVVGSDGKTLFKADFADGMAKWQSVRGQWEGAKGVLTQSSRAVDCQTFVGEDTWANYTYSLKAKRTGGTEGFLIMFAAENNLNMIRWNIGGWGNTRTAVEYFRVGGKTEISGSAVGLRVENDKWYDIKIEIRGGVAQLYFDGKLITTVEDRKARSTLPDAGPPPSMINNGRGPQRANNPGTPATGRTGVPAPGAGMP